MKNDIKKRYLTKVIFVGICILAMVLLVAIMLALFKGENYMIISLIIAILTLAPFFIFYEKKQTSARELTIIAVMTSLSVVSRIVFMPLPGFKPVAAIVIITALCLGSEAGFITGSFSALVSNMFFGQGAWTPLQMLAWGLLGFFLGLLSGCRIAKTYPFLILWGIIGGIIFSLIMDLWTVLSFNEGINLARYFALVGASLPFMIIYVVSNIIFLLLLYKPISKKLERIKTKYMLFLHNATDLSREI